MKKLITAAFLCTACITAFAQGNKVVSAKMHLDEYIKDQDTMALKDAKTSIDEAALNDKTKNEPKMFLYRGEVYEALYGDKLSSNSKKALMSSGKMTAQAVQEAQTKAYIETDTSYLLTAVYSFEQVIQLAPKDFYADEARQELQKCSAHMANKAIADYNNGNFKSSFVFFEKTLNLAKAQGASDTSRAYVQLLQNTALTAARAGNTPKAIGYYNQMIASKVGGPAPYTTLIKLYMEEKDTNKAMEVVKQGRAAYPNDIDLLISETNGYMWKHDNDKAIGDLQAVIDKISKEPKPTASEKSLLAQLYFAMGGIYDKQANPRDAEGKDLPKPANYTDVFSKAESSYQHSLAIDSNSFETNFNMGALYNNRAKYLFDQMRALPDKDQATKGKPMADEAKTWLTKAQPYLEKAHAIKPDGPTVKRVLIGLYASTGQDDKAKALVGQH